MIIKAPAFPLALLACAMASSGAAKMAVSINDDRFSKFVGFDGPVISKIPLVGTGRSYHLGSRLDRRTARAQHFLFVDVHYLGDPEIYWRAADDTTRDLSVRRIAFGRTVRKCQVLCAYEETVGVELPDGLLAGRRKTGFKIKLYARSGDTLVVDVAPKEITEQLDAIERYQAKPGG